MPTCWEQLASRTALDQLTGKDTETLARARHVAAAGVFDTYGERVGTGLVILLAIFRPGRVVIAGGAARFLDLFGHGLRRSLDRGPKYTPKPTVVAAELGNLSGAIGAAVMAREQATPQARLTQQRCTNPRHRRPGNNTGQRSGQPA